MATEKPGLDGYEIALEAKVAAWQAALNAYRAAKAIDGALGEADSTISTGALPIDLPVGVFRDKTIKEAIKIYLGAGRRKQTNKEIATGLLNGGLVTTADNFDATVATALYRLKEEGAILRFDDGWDLAASYPEGLRSRLEKDAKPAKKAARAARHKKPGARKSAPKAKKASGSAKRPPEMKAEKTSGPVRPGLEQRIDAYLQTRGSESTTVQELASQLKVPVTVLNLMLGKMKKANKIEKNPSGLIRLTKKAA